MRTEPVEGPAVPRSHGVAGYVFALLWRSQVVMLLLGGGAAAVIGSFVLTYLTPETELRTFLDAAYLGVELLAVLAPVLGSTVLTIQEFEQRTLWLVLVRPVSRRAYTTGRFRGLAAASAAVVLAPAALVALLLWAARALPEPWLAGVAVAAVLEAGVVAAVACLVTMATTSWVTAALVEFGVIVLGYASSLLPVLAAKPALLPLKPLLIAVYWMLPHLFRFAVRDLSVPPEPWYFAALLGYAAAYTACVLTLAAWSSERREV